MSLDKQIIGGSEASEQIRTFIQRIAEVDYPVLIIGETGVGKEIVARNIHQFSCRMAGPFIPVNCASIPQYLAESEFFGHRKGSFTDAKEHKEGLIEAAKGGTVFLDEVAELPPNIQAKLLRALEEKELRRVGETVTRKVDARFICATNKNLEKEMRTGRFRQDLYFRINVLNLRIPPLRERKDDIVLFADKFINEANKQYRKNKRISPETLVKLLDYPFPGNIRELENIIIRAYVLSKKDEIEPGDIIFDIEEEGGNKEIAMKLYKEIVFEGKGFWEVVYKPFLRRDLNRKQVKDIVSFGLRKTKGSYKKLLPLLNIGESERDYKKFMRSITVHRLR
jgi:transcriptional regulator with GAF, ATPase, and Fis domain